MKTEKILGRPLQSPSVVQQIVEQITEAILKGELTPGSKLPTETELCASMGVGRNSVREAVKILEAYGVVQIRRADGTYICESYTQKMLDPMLYGVLLMKNSSDEIIQLRQAIDVGILYLLMGQITSGRLSALEGSLENLRQAVEGGDRNSIMAADINFHLDIARLTGNELLCTVYTYVDRITTPSRMRALDRILDTGHLADFIKLHQELIDILREQRIDGIGSTLTEHYTFWKQIKEN